MSTETFVLSVAQIVWIDILLSGDNAVVIALACRALPPKQRTIGITLGVVLALALRIGMAAVISYVLAIPLIKALGGLLLLYIAVKVIKGEDEDDTSARGANKLLAAVLLIVWADATMSLDNVVAIAAASKGSDIIFVIGLLLSMPLMIAGSSLITAVVTRIPIIVWAGGGLLGWVAGGMIIDDDYVLGAATKLIPADWLGEFSQYFTAGLGAVLVIGAAIAIRLWKRGMHQPTQLKSHRVKDRRPVTKLLLSE